jgi:hypothetical protein
MLFPEHRYYGDSYPFGEFSHTPINITFLSVQQVKHVLKKFYIVFMYVYVCMCVCRHWPIM